MKWTLYLAFLIHKLYTVGTTTEMLLGLNIYECLLMNHWRGSIFRGKGLYPYQPNHLAYLRPFSSIIQLRFIIMRAYLRKAVYTKGPHCFSQKNTNVKVRSQSWIYIGGSCGRPSSKIHAKVTDIAYEIVALLFMKPDSQLHVSDLKQCGSQRVDFDR